MKRSGSPDAMMARGLLRDARVQRETPNYQLVDAHWSAVLVKPLTKLPDPTPQLSGIKKQLVTTTALTAFSAPSRFICLPAIKQAPVCRQSSGPTLSNSLTRQQLDR